ncbi:dihydrolipoamide acetyltransferase family protein [Agrobacterium larrymoorei]|uniref:Dihydrolipoamide acetyltransferase component of pyruvate dehydrogenase complex n=1 Tax=Agrobacterium larrymoorei TaxID=160699 RepID=A0A4D7DYG5_9HYPH|nr:dihydrolipoamide acetyltransferase family protein [Agrobacterium larrymoorei]QCI99859.1 2-oxo acid dehydrogenase subunit E2 [Agrobacterium larrymoorei]QYA09702.1 2-oxo acid dehydrogenase subunit E2 [Agrobacterium larrymoorei]
MAEFVLKMPDVGEGVAEAELVEWHVKPGDPVREDMVLAAVMTDKATVEIPSPVAGIVTWVAADIGDTVAVKAPLVRIETEVDAAEAKVAEPETQPLKPPEIKAAKPQPQSPPSKTKPADAAPPSSAVAPSAQKPLASPAVRRRAQEAGIDLRQLRGTGPAGRVTHEDLDGFSPSGSENRPSSSLQRRTTIEEVKITGLRRKIAEKMALSVSRIPHITYVEEVDVSDLEDLRATMNAGRKPDQPKLTILPFLMRALVKTVGEQPAMNATFDDDAGVVKRYGAVHIGIAAQTPAGLVVPVVRHAEARGIWDCAGEVARVSDAARNGSAQREELSGSTITISSLGALGGIASTPVINHPEVAIIGVNKIAVRPVWDGNQFIPRKMMNLSSSFDHRVVDGFDAATFIQRIKALLETPALIFIES